MKRFHFCFVLMLIVQISFAQITSLKRLDLPSGLAIQESSRNIPPAKLGFCVIDNGATLEVIRTGEQHYYILSFDSVNGSIRYGIVLGNTPAEATETLTDLRSLCSEDRDSSFSFNTRSAPQGVANMSKSNIVSNHSIIIAKSKDLWRGKSGLTPYGEELIAANSSGNKLLNPYYNVLSIDERVESGTIVILWKNHEYHLSEETICRAILSVGR